MDLHQLETVAQQAVRNSKNYVQVWNKTPLRSDFPIPYSYVGYTQGCYVYNLDALALVQAFTRHKLEFEIN